MASKAKLWLVLALAALACGLGYILSGTKEVARAGQAVDDAATQATGLGAVKVGEELKDALRGLDHERDVRQARETE